MIDRVALFVTCLADTLYPEVGQATVTVLDCDLEGFCDTVSSEPAQGRLEVRWTPADRTTFGPGVSFATPAHAVGVAFDGELDLVGDLSGQIYR